MSATLSCKKVRGQQMGDRQQWAIDMQKVVKVHRNHLSEFSCHFIVLESWKNSQCFIKHFLYSRMAELADLPPDCGRVIKELKPSFGSGELLLWSHRSLFVSTLRMKICSEAVKRCHEVKHYVPIYSWEWENFPSSLVVLICHGATIIPFSCWSLTCIRNKHRKTEDNIYL